MRLLIADDHSIFRKSFINLLRATLTPTPECFEAENGLEALKKVEEKPFDIIFLDVRMPEMNGIDAFKLIKESRPAIPIIILTQFDESALIQHFFKMGAHSFLTKHTDLQEIKMAIDLALKGERYFSTEIQSIIDKVAKAKELQQKVELTAQEKRLFGLLCKGYTSKEIAQQMSLAVTTVDTYRERLLKKTRTRNVAQLISFGFKNGMIS
jgi:DNA-binding NarL/FixJ family response regulator